ncbi:MAG: MFS transporter [Nocardiopsis sp. BM-2018]|nr:MAG: MFS transporter [Nocardiopsis sp. BM-2018]
MGEFLPRRRKGAHGGLTPGNPRDRLRRGTSPALAADPAAGPRRGRARGDVDLGYRRSPSPVLAPALVADPAFLGWRLATLTTSVGFLGVLVFLPSYLQTASGLSPAVAGVAMLLLTAPVLVAPMGTAALVNRGVPAAPLIIAALALVTGGNLGLVFLAPENTIAVTALPLLVIGAGMGMSFGIADGQAMAVVPPDAVGAAAGFLNTLRGAAEALVIAAFSAALIGFLGLRLGDTEHAGRVASGHRSPDGAVREVEALTWSWHMTQVGVALFCLVLSVVVGCLILRGREKSAP